ncbi:urease subunit gamma [Aquimarina sp. RZ0]|uniref:urease subunit gamma n=1 Tax=Aquimarina sp. RZ0 TaxID=2607730 RepID=UPI0011F31222|nr:urease subunit gamma [Aquimarina sp. RZ0]KAA1247496.1 urease subunit gamma [Aquimarina sp. RZ0]
MRLTPRDIEKLMLHQAGFVAQKRYARGLKLNYPETIALISTQLLELIREGYAVAELMNLGKQIIGLDDVMEGVEKMIHEVQVEGTFPDGTKLVTVHHPICQKNITNGLALYGSGLTKSEQKIEVDNSSNKHPGNYEVLDEEIELNQGRETISLLVINKGDRPVQVGSHYPFAETNQCLEFDRAITLKYRLNIPAGTAVRFEPGEEKEVELVEMAGEVKVYGGNALINGTIENREEEIIATMKQQNYIQS